MELDNTNFINSSGWPDENHFSSAADIAKISSFLIKDFPEHYSLYKEKWFTYGVKQPHRNRNTLLWQDDSIDGIKKWKDAGGKVIIRMMPDLPGSTPDSFFLTFFSLVMINTSISKNY